ncbi:MAG: hypothetical protein HQM13_20615 [SAR324 cluster bacterium]|nr:hypothetical protein [SAR324 cluster bacterium]
MKATKFFGFFMIGLFQIFLCNPVFAEHQTLSLETDLAAAAAPYRRIGYDLEIWLYPWLAVGAGREVDTGLDTKNFIQDADTNKPLTLRFVFSGFFVKFSSLERQYRIEKKDSSTPIGTTSEPKRKANLTGARTSLGYWYEWDSLFFTIGVFQESLSTHKFAFNDETTKEVGGDLSGPFLTIGVAF